MSLLLCALTLFLTPPQGIAPVSPAAHARSLSAEGQETKTEWPLTVAESSGFQASSRLSDVEAFLAKLEALPFANRLSAEIFGQSGEGRDLTVVRVSAQGPESGLDEPEEASEARRLLVLVNANIHGGEIEGKVAVQILLREFALGYHADLLEELDLAFVPVFNADGNDRIARTNRATQNGPNGGVGERANAAGLDLNRDFVKLETPEVRALTELIRDTSPDAFMDLHTTNGSPHGYDLTYASSLSPNADEGLAGYMAEDFFPSVRTTLLGSGLHIFDYGNFGYAPRERGSRGDRGDPIRWSTYDSRPRFGTNLMGLRGTVSILSEAYSYLPYERRVLVTYAFVLESLRKLARDADSLKAIIEAARASRSQKSPGSSQRVLPELGVDAELEAVGRLPVRVSRYEEVPIDVDPDTEGVQEMRRRVAEPSSSAREVTMEVLSRFKAARKVRYGREFLIPEPSAALLDVLESHLGASELRLTAEASTAVVLAFVVEEALRSERVFQGHREASVRGRWEERTLDLPAGALRVTANPLVAHLLHPESDDSLTTWNFFDAALFPEEPAPAGVNSKVLRTHPVHMVQ